MEKKKLVQLNDNALDNVNGGTGDTGINAKFKIGQKVKASEEYPYLNAMSAVFTIDDIYVQNGITMYKISYVSCWQLSDGEPIISTIIVSEEKLQAV